jgi:allantoin racemase
MKLRIVVPLGHSRFNQIALEECQRIASPGTEITIVNLEEGPDSIESEYEEALAVPGFLKRAREAEAQGCDAVVSDCFGDPGVRPAREALAIPVIGPAETSMLLASALAQRFSVLTVLPSVVPMIEGLAHHAGVLGKLASSRAVNIPVLCLEDKDKLKAALYEEGLLAIRNDGAHALVLGCTGMMGVARELQEKFAACGLAIPVIDPIAAAIRMAETLVSLGLTQSRLTYRTPKGIGSAVTQAAQA